MTTRSVFADCWYLSGPTAGGKSVVGLWLARLLNAEIISLDSMAVYRGMDIGTAKPSALERAQVPHHLLDVVDPDEEFSLARYLEAAAVAVEQIRARNRVPLFVGGTPLYLKALLRGIFSGPAADWQLRQELLAIAQNQGAETLHARLAEVDPRSAMRLHPNDTRRVVRALEVWEKTGSSITELQRQFDRTDALDGGRVFVLWWPRDELIQRIDARVDQMFAEGLVDEVRGLLGRYQKLSRAAGHAVGYRETIEHLDGVRNLSDTIDLVKLRTRQFAKRQMTWFRSLGECRWVSRTDGDVPDMIAQNIAEMGSKIV